MITAILSMIESYSIVHVIMLLLIYFPSNLSVITDQWRSLEIYYGWIYKQKFCTSKASLHGKTVVITGASSGIGKEVALDLAKRGAKIILGCITMNESEEAAKDIRQRLHNFNGAGEIVARELDLSSLDSVRKFSQQILNTEKEINILINNAGIVSGERHETKDGFELVFAVNYLGHFLLTCLLLPCLISSSPSRIINVSSVAHLGTINFDDLSFKQMPYSPLYTYASSKLAVVLFTRELSRRLEGTGVTTYAVHPGNVGSCIWEEFYKHYCPPIGWFLLKKIKEALPTAYDGAQTTIFCAVDENVANESGYYYFQCEKRSPSRIARDNDVAKRLWIESEKLVGLQSNNILSHTSRH